MPSDANARPFRAHDGEDLSRKALEELVADCSNPEFRSSLQNEGWLFWHFAFNPHRNCERLEVPEPKWLKDLLWSAPDEYQFAEAQPPPLSCHPSLGEKNRDVTEADLT